MNAFPTSNICVFPPTGNFSYFLVWPPCVVSNGKYFYTVSFFFSSLSRPPLVLSSMQNCLKKIVRFTNETLSFASENYQQNLNCRNFLLKPASLYSPTSCNERINPLKSAGATFVWNEEFCFPKNWKITSCYSSRLQTKRKRKST